MKCPSCFFRLPLDEFRYGCAGSCTPKPDAQASAVRGIEIKGGPVVQRPTEGRVTCPGCQGPTVEVCPACHYPLAPDLRSAHTTCIAMAGARNTGKSVLIAVAMLQMRLLVTRELKSALLPLGDTGRRFEDRYVRFLLRERRLLEPTASIGDGQDSVAREPLYWSFKERMPDGGTRRRVLVIRDVAGEDLENQDRGAALDFFGRASAVLCLVDPLKVPKINHLLTDLVPTTERLGGDGLHVLGHVLNLMSRPGEPRTPVPVGVVLSKVDVLQKLRWVQGNVWSAIMNRPGSPMQRDPSMKNGWPHHAGEGRLLHHEVLSLLDHLNSSEITHMIRDAVQHHQYFAVSALGESPSGEMVHSGGIAPFRALDPFTWALAMPT